MTSLIRGSLYILLCMGIVATAWYYKRQIRHIRTEYGLKVKDRALTVKKYADELQKLGIAMTDSQTGQRYGQEVRKMGNRLEQYANTLIQQIQGPQSEFEIKEFGLLMPKLSKKFSEQANQIKRMQILILKYRSKLAVTDLKLNMCQMTGGKGISDSEMLRLEHEAQARYKRQVQRLDAELETCGGGTGEQWEKSPSATTGK